MRTRESNPTSFDSGRGNEPRQLAGVNPLTVGAEADQPVDREGQTWRPIHSDDLPLEIARARLSSVWQCGRRQFVARCPVYRRAHGNRTRTLKIRETENHDLLMHCLAGCTTEEICTELGITDAALSATDGARARRWRHPSSGAARPARAGASGPSPNPWFTRLDEQCQHHPDHRQQIRKLAVQLGVSVPTLDRLGVGWSDRYGGVWTVPERDDQSRIFGITYRYADGTEYLAPGGRRGLILPRHPTYRGPLYICEGLDDTAVMTEAGRRAIGRGWGFPSPLLMWWLKRAVWSVSGDDSIVVVGDRDTAGQAGARKLAEWLSAGCGRAVRWALPQPDYKDVSGQWQATGTVKFQLQSSSGPSDPTP